MPSALTPIVGPYKIVLAINCQGVGWLERWILNTNAPNGLIPSTSSSFPGNIGTISAFAYYRTAFFGAGTQIVYAHASQVGKNKDGIAGDLPYPMGPHSALGNIDAPDNPFVAVQQRYETAAGLWYNQMFTGIPDSWVVNDKLVNQLPWRPLMSGAPVDPTVTTNSLLQIQQSFWSFLLQNVPHSTLTAKGNLWTYNQIDNLRIIPRKVSRHLRGRPFGLSRGRHPKFAIA
jgi:hypothetical protein